MIANEKLNIKRIETKILNGRKINIKVVLEIETKLYSNEEISVIANINNSENVQILNREKVVNSLLGFGNTKAFAKDTITIDSQDDLAEIMRASIKIINKDIKISYNKILAKADSYISIMYLTEDNKIKSISATIPVMGFVDLENISEENICDVYYNVKNLIIKPNSGDLHSIYVEAEIEIECFAYETRTINLIEDLYSIDSNLKFNPKEILAMSCKENIKDNCKINNEVSIPEMVNDTLYCIEVVPTSINQTLRNGRIIFEGELSLEFIYAVSSGIDSRTIEIPFNFEITSENIDNNCNVDTNIDVKSCNYTVNNGNIDINIELEFNVNSCKNQQLSIIDQIEVEEDKDNNIYSMVIYFVKPGDTIWKIAKKFKSTVEEISKINNIEDENKIRVGQQLYIPRHVNKQVAV